MWAAIGLATVLFGASESEAALASAPLEETHGMALAQVINVASHFVGSSEHLQFARKNNKVTRVENRGDIVEFSFQFCYIESFRPGKRQEYERKDGNPWCQCFVNAVTTLALLFEIESMNYQRNFNESASTIKAFKSAQFALHASGKTSGAMAMRSQCRLALADVAPGWTITFERKGTVGRKAGHVGLITEVRGPYGDGSFEVETIEGNIQRESGRTESENEQTPEGVWRKTHRIRPNSSGGLTLVSDTDDGIRLKGFYPTLIPRDPKEACTTLTGNRPSANSISNKIQTTDNTPKQLLSRTLKAPARAVRSAIAM